MGEVDTERQALNVARMRLLGADGDPGDAPARRTLKDAINEALRDWVTNVDDTHYLLGTVAGPAPVPGDGARLPPRHRRRGPRSRCSSATGRLPDAVAACVGGGSNAIGIFHAFLDDADVRLVGFEAGGDGVETGRHGATHHRRRARRAARRAVLPAAGRGRPDRRVALDLRRASTTPASGRSTRCSRTSAAATYEPVTDAEAMDAFALLCRTEGIIPAIESAHALAGRAAARPRAGARRPSILVNLSGRGDKDVDTAGDYFGFESW